MINGEVFKNVNNTLRAFAVLPVTTANSVREFSALEET